jgi:branched-chain amino acid transport system substrate-binding protein
VAQAGRDILSGVQLALIEENWKVAGRKIELISEDTEAKPAVALTKIRKLVEKDRVHMLIGGNMTSTGYALQPYVDSRKMPTVYPIIAANDLTQRKRAKWIIRTGWSSSQPSHPFGEYAYKELGYRKIATLGYDFAFSYETIGGFQRTFEEAGGRVIQKLWPAVGVLDFAPYLGQFSKDADAIFVVLFGAGALQFGKQYKEFGLKDKTPLIANGTTTDEHVLPSMGDEAIGIITALQYSAALDSPTNKKFAKAFADYAGKIASYYGEGGYTGGKWIIGAMKGIQGDVEDRNKLMKALKTLKLTDVPRGPIEIDKYGNPIQNIYIRKVERVDGKLQNSVIKTYPKVSQFWKWDPEQYLKEPLYTRDYPPIKK